MAYTQADYENQVREYLQDTGTSNNNRVIEDLTVQVVGGNGSRTVFTLSKNNILSTSAYPAVDVNQAGFSTGWVSSVDATNGILTTSSAPQLSTTVPTYVQVLYYFNEFTDGEIDRFVNFGLGQVEATAPMTGSTSSTAYQNFSPAQFNVACLFGTAMGYYELANKYAGYVDASAEGKSLAKGMISKQYMELSKQHLDWAYKEREAIYAPRQGRASVPSSIMAGQGGQPNYNAFPRAFNYGGKR